MNEVIRIELDQGKKILHVRNGDLVYAHVWLNNQTDFDGICIGTGNDATAAIEDAIRLLSETMGKLSALNMQLQKEAEKGVELDR